MNCHREGIGNKSSNPIHTYILRIEIRRCQEEEREEKRGEERLREVKRGEEKRRMYLAVRAALGGALSNLTLVTPVPVRSVNK